ncbi:hypothetical protein NXY26_12305 [Parabacteroides distasonis]|nr:hypothetical protein NXY26_12305 [Parabacteroides distasonis]
MKRLVMAMSALLVSVTMSFAQESSLHKEPFVVNVAQLVSYLELRPSQINEVAMINDYFREKQSEGLRGSHKMRDKRMRQAVFGNLKLMKKALSTDQYRKYVALINVTNNNNRMTSGLSFPDVYLADK